MDEFEDSVALLTLTKNRLLREGYMNKLQEVDVPDSQRYNYLLYHALYTMHNRERFADRIRNIYWDVMLRQEAPIPELYDIVDIIDEENMIIIQEFYRAYDYSENDIDIAIAHYTQDVNCVLDDWVAQILRDDGVPYMGFTVSEMFERQHMSVASLGAQNVLIKELLY
jgi:hypothetical protein